MRTRNRTVHDNHAPLVGRDVDDNGPATPTGWWAFRAWSNKTLFATDLMFHTPLSDRLLQPTSRWYRRIQTPLPDWAKDRT